MSPSDDKTIQEPGSKTNDDKPDTPKPDTAKPAPAAKPAATKPDTTKPDTAKPAPAATKPDTTKPDTAKPAATKPDTTKPDTAKSAPAAKPAPPKPVARPPAKKPAAEPVPEFEKGITERVISQFGDETKITFIKPRRIGIRASKQTVHDVALYLRDSLNFDHAESVTGVDYPQDNEIEVVYHLGSYTDDRLAGQVLELATRAPREERPNPGNDSTKLPTLRDVFYSVEFHERECFEMLGVYFEGHPDNRRLLLPEDWADMPPLRKDFAIKGR